MYENPLAEEVCREFGQVSGQRMNWESLWNEIAERIDPNNKNTFSIGNMTTPGEKKTEFQLDATPELALDDFTAIMISLLTPDNAKWHRIGPSDRNLLKSRNVRLWFEEANTVLWEQRRRTTANFSGQNYQSYRQLGAYGTGTLFIDGLSGAPGLRYKSVHIGQIYYRENHQGLIDTAFRRFPMTARQIQQRAPAWTIPKDVQNAIDAKQLDKEFFVIHRVAPRQDIDRDRRDYRRMPIASCYVLETGQKAVLQEHGYNSFPYAIGRYVQATNEIYGRSPAMSALPSIRTLQAMKKTVLQQGHRIVDPPLLLHDDGILEGFALRAGSTHGGGVNADGRPLVHPLPAGRLDIGLDMMDIERGLVNKAFLVALFQILEEDRPEMTATEVLERTREKGILLAPTVGRQQSEYLGPMIERELDVLSQQGLLPPMPRELVEAGGGFKTEYDNPMAKAARAEEASGIIRTMDTALNVAQMTADPEPLDHFNWDVIIPEIAHIAGAPERFMRAEEDILQRRADRAKANQAAQQAQQAPGAAALMSSMAKVKEAGKK